MSNSKRKLLRMGYSIKHSFVGWWVDGSCGYQVAGYYDTEHEAVEKALEKISEAKDFARTPVWLFQNK